MSILAAVIAGAMTASGAAPAPSQPSQGWQFAKWGMNSAQVHAASHGAVRKATDGDYDTLAGGYSMDKFKFSVTFDYRPPSDDPGSMDPARLGLAAVMLDLDTKSAACSALEAYLKTKYGKPVQILASGPAGDRWSTKAFGDIQYSTWNGKKCSVMYMAYGTSNQ